jgi:AcrR family transcriptional regulator
VADRRQQILDVAKEMFAERGVGHTTVRQIGARAGILSGSLYHYFESKADIVDAVLSDFCKVVLGNYWQIASRNHLDPAEQLRQMTRYGFSLVTDHSAALLIAHRDANELIRETRFKYLIDFDQEIERRYTDVFVRGIESGRFKSDADPRVLYRFIRDAIVGAIRWYVPGRGASTDEIADTMVDVVLIGILAETG